MAIIKNIFKSIVAKVEKGLHWMIDNLEDPEARNEILKSLGLPQGDSSTSLNVPKSSLDSINAFTATNDEDIKLEEFASVVLDIINVTNAIEDFANMVAHDDPEIGLEFLDFVLQLYLLDYARLRSTITTSNTLKYESLFGIIQGLDLFNELTTTSGDLFGIGSLIRFFETGIAAFDANNKDWAYSLYDWTSLTQAQNAVILNTLTGQARTDFEAAELMITEGSNQFFLAPVNLLPYQFKNAGISLNATEWDFVWDHLPDVAKYEYSEKQIRLATDWIFILSLLTSAIIPIFIKSLSGLTSNILKRTNFGFDPSPLSVSPVADRITERALTMFFEVENTDNTGIETSATLFLSAALQPVWHGGLGIKMRIEGDIKLEKKFDDGWTLSVASEGLPSENSAVEIELKTGGETTRLIIGDSKGTRLELGTVSFSLKGSVEENELDFNIAFKNCAFVIAKGNSDSFIGKILPDKGISGNFDIGIGYSVKKKLYLDGGSGLSVLIPLHDSVTSSSKNNLTLNSVFLQGKNNDANTESSIETSVGFTASLLGISVTVERIGLLQKFTYPDGLLKAGNRHYSIGFKSPNGVGLSFNIGGLKGGGFLYLDSDKGEYVGALELQFHDWLSLKAIGIINTKLPGISDYSLLIIITAQFNPPLETPLGFSIKAVGGLLGLNRTVNTDVLREGIKTNSIKSILFPEDVIANIARIISDIKQVFPPMQDHTVVGPMAELEWSSMVSLQIGIILEIPGYRVAILGVFKVECPTHKKPLILIQVNFLGIIDIENKFISFDASLYNSKILTYTLTGDMAFRLSWGDPSIFLLSVGGFHPAFHDAPQDLQHMTRFTISLLSGHNPRFTVQGYFAITSNTVQFGAKAELYAGKGSFNIYGFIAFDVLFQFDPFMFIADFAAGVALRHNTSVIMGIGVKGELSGPGPWNVHGNASVSFFFFSITIPFSCTWGDPPDETQVEQADIIALLSTEINDNHNWTAEIPAHNNLHVSVRNIDLPAGQEQNIVVHPFGILTFSERIVPLEVAIDKFGEQKPKDANLFTVNTTDTDLAVEKVKEQFAPANFFKKTDSEKLSSPSFEPLISGFKITGSATLQAPPPVTKNVDYEITYLKSKQKKSAGRYTLSKSVFKAGLKGGSVTKSPVSFARNRVSSNAPDAVAIQPNQFAIANISDMRLHDIGLVAGSYTEATQLYNDLISSQPGLEEHVQIISQHELNFN